MEETEGGLVRAISVSLEIKRFQEEINKVQAENCQFYQWKLRRAASRPSLGPSLSPAEREGVLGRARGCPICLSDWRRTPGTAEGGRRGNERAALNLVHRLI